MSNDERVDEMHGDNDAELMAQARALSQDVQPERDLWPAIEVAIREPDSSVRRASKWQPMMAQAAVVLLLIGGSSTLTWLAVKDDGPGLSPVASSSDGFPLNATSASFSDRYSLGPDFRDARRDLEARLASELDQLPPEARAIVRENLNTIRRAIAEINGALVEEPNNALLQELLLSSYREELAVMRKVNVISSAVMLREDI